MHLQAKLLEDDLRIVHVAAREEETAPVGRHVARDCMVHAIQQAALSQAASLSNPI